MIQSRRHELNQLLAKMSPDHLSSYWQIDEIARNGGSASTQRILVKAASASYPVPIAVKIFPDHDAGRNWASREYAALVKYHAAMKDHPGFSVPKPLACQGAAYAMQWISARRLVSLLMLGIVIPNLRRHCLFVTGKWLSTFHRIGDAELAPLDSVFWFDSINVGAGTSKAWSDAMRRTRAIAPVLAGAPIVHSQLHGDYTARNLFITRSQAIGFDFGLFDRGPSAFDCADLLIHAGRNCIAGHPASWVGDSRTFYNGYCNLAGEDARARIFAKLLRVLKHWARHEVAAQDEVESMRWFQALQARRLNRLARYLLAQLTRDLQLQA